MKSVAAFLASVVLASFCSYAAVPRDFAVDLQATVSDTAPHITLSWTLRLPSDISSQRIHRRLKGATAWTQLSNLTPSTVSYTDNTAVVGTEYEYWLERRFTGVLPTVATGYLSAGVKVPEIQSRGILLLLIDSTMVTPLAPEIELLKADLAGDGWTVKTIVAPRTGTAISTKALIKSAYDADPANTKALYILGRVPIPYSGLMAPDGHRPDHLGAWPADSYYADMDGNWTDTIVNNTDASGTRNDNVPGDGKFDQNTLPSAVELEVGRVDLAGLNRAPTSSASEVVRLRRYLRRAHQFRHKVGPYANIPRRSIIRDGFGYFGGEIFAVQGWATALTTVGPTIHTPGSNQWFTQEFASGRDYLFGLACGAGSYDSASGLGNSRDFGTKASRVVFTSLFGSYFGDWGYDDNLMRAAICGNADDTSLGLTCLWSGRPHWFTHHPGMGETWGYATKASMNAGMTGGGGYLPLGLSGTFTHIALMGDPALRMHMVAPPRAVAATSSDGEVTLNWAASTEDGVVGYHIYRATSVTGPFTRLTDEPVTTTSYTDPEAPPGSSLTYLVKSLKLESVPGGSFYNLSIGSPVTIVPSETITAAPANPSELEAIVTLPTVLAGFHQFDDSTVTSESADLVEPGFTGTVTKSTESRSSGGSNDHFFGDSKIKSPNTSDGFLRMTGNFTVTVVHDGSIPWLLDSLLLDATSISSGVLLHLSYSLNGGSPVPLTSSPLTLPTSTDSPSVQPYGDFSIPITGVVFNPQDTIVFTFSLASGSGARLDNIALTAVPPDPSTTVSLSWEDNSSDETGFRIERKSSSSEDFTEIATVPANTTRYTDTNVPYQNSIYIYRVIALGAADSSPSNQAFYEPMPGFVAFNGPLAKYDKSSGIASIPVSRNHGSHGLSTVSYTTANSSATGGTHFTTTSGTLTWQDGESGTKFIHVPLAATPSYPRQFKVILSNPNGGMGLGVQTSHSALIEDPAGTLEAPWTFNTLGSITHSSPAITLNGAIGDALVGGTAPVAGGTTETGHFIHQMRTGNGRLVMRVRSASPIQNSARYGVMVRGSLNTGSQMAVTLTSSNTSFGTKFLYRPTTNTAIEVPGSPDWPGNTNSTVISCWVRLTRLGDRFISEVSTDGTAWTILASQTLTNFPANAYWGIYHSADSPVVDYQLGNYENITIGPPPLPATPTSFTIPSTGSDGALLAWSAQQLATSHRIERRGDDGSEVTFETSAASSHTDTTALADTSYEYRITAVNSAGSSPATSFLRATTPPGTSAPVRPGFLSTTATPGTGIVLSWFDASSNNDNVGIERKAIHGEWSPLHTLPSGGITYSDSSVLPGVHYHYRVRNTPSGQNSSWATHFPMPSAPAVVAPGTASGYQLWLLENQLPMDESGAGSATAMPTTGTLPLLIKYALGLPADAPDHSGHLIQGSHMEGDHTYATLSFTQPFPIPSGIICVVERSPDLSQHSWTETGVILLGTTQQSGTITSTYRLSDSQSATGKQFMRFRVSKD